MNKGERVELALTWDKDVAKGTLRVGAETRSVGAEMYKGLILVQPSRHEARHPQDGIATVTTEGAKRIQIGDYEQPWLDCK